jgi:hypothetical protein
MPVTGAGQRQWMLAYNVSQRSLATGALYYFSLLFD